MKDNLKGITVKEAIIILTIVQKLDFHNWKKAQKIGAILEAKNPITSKGFLDFRNAFLLFAENGTKPTHCCICGERLEKGHMICPSCLAELKKRAGIEKASEKEGKQEKKDKVNKVTIEKVTEEKTKENEMPDANVPMKQKRRWKKWGVAILCGVALFALVVVIGFRNTNKLGDINTTAAFVENYQQLLEDTHSGFFLSEPKEVEEGITGYTIKPSEDMLFLFSDTKGRFQGIGLQMQGKDEESKTRQLYLMSLTHLCLYEGMTTEESDKLITSLLKQNGDMTYKNDHWMLTFSGPNTIYMILPDSVQTKSLETVNMPYADGFQLLGKPYETVREILGDSTTVISENTRYYEDKGLSLLYQMDTGIITYVDVDGSGTVWQDYPIMGITCGMSQKEAAKMLTDMGLKEIQDTDEWEYILDIDRVKYKLTISLVQDKVALVSVMIQK